MSPARYYPSCCSVTLQSAQFSILSAVQTLLSSFNHFVARHAILEVSNGSVILQDTPARGQLFIGAVVGTESISFYGIEGQAAISIDASEIPNSSNEKGMQQWLEQHFSFVRCHLPVTADVRLFAYQHKMTSSDSVQQQE